MEKDTGVGRAATLTILTSVFAVNFLDRQIVSLLAQPIKGEFQLSDTEMGALYGFGFALIYGVVGLPIAKFADKGRRALVINCSLVFFSLMSGLCGLATGYWQLLAARIGVAIGESGTNPPSHSIISDHYDVDRRSTAMAIFSLGPNVGVLLGFLISGWVSQVWGWRAAFLTASALGLLVSIVSWTFLKDTGGRHIQSSTDNLSIREALRSVLSLRATRHIVFASMLVSMASYAILGWLPSFLIRGGLEIGKVGTILALIFGLAGAVPTFLGGVVADKIAKGNPGRRMVILATVMALMAPAWLIVFSASGLPVIIGLLVVPGAFLGFYLGPTFAMVQTLVEPGVRSTAAALLVFTGNVIGLGLGPLAVGRLSDALVASAGTGSLRYAMMISAPLYLWAAVHYLIASTTINGDVEVTQISAAASPIS